MPVYASYLHIIVVPKTTRRGEPTRSFNFLRLIDLLTAKLDIFHSRAAGHEIYVLRGNGVNEFIPEKCDMHELREYNVKGMVGLYKRVIPYQCVTLVFYPAKYADLRCSATPTFIWPVYSLATGSPSSSRSSFANSIRTVSSFSTYISFSRVFPL